MDDVLYFGCRGEAGHYFHRLNQFESLEPPEGFPWGLTVDGRLQPPVQREPRGGYTGAGFRNGDAVRHVKDGWTAVAYWDRTVDSRPGSCSVLICRGVFTTPEVVARVRHVMPDCVRVDVKEIAVVGDLALPDRGPSAGGQDDVIRGGHG